LNISRTGSVALM